MIFLALTLATMPAVDPSDLRCFAIFDKAANEDPDDEAEMAAAVAAFFLGRLSASDGFAGIKPALADVRIAVAALAKPEAAAAGLECVVKIAEVNEAVGLVDP